MRQGIAISLLLFGQLVLAASFEHVVWDKSPIKISLPVGKERMVSFDSSVTLLHNELEGFAIIQKTKDTFYIKALREFDSKSVAVRTLTTGEIIKLYLSVDASNTNQNPIQIITKDQIETANDNNITSSQTPINYITLTRYAIQKLFAPERLLEIPQGVVRTPMNTHKSVKFIKGESVMAYPLASFGGDGLTVSAVRIHILLTKTQTIELDMLFGNWASIAFYPTNTLAPKGHISDETVVFVTSHKSFSEARNETQGYVR